MRIGILGPGLMGAKLGTLWARAGHAVTFSYARSARKLEQLAREAGRRRRAPRPSLLHCGDDAIARRAAARLIRDVGFDPVDAGPLRSARFIEPFTLLIARLAYEGRRGPRLAYRFEWHPRV